MPSFTAFAVTKLLRDHFGDFVETDFTAEMEDDLDEISRGEREWWPSCASSITATRSTAGSLPAVEDGAEKADYPLLDLGTDAESGEPMRVRIGRFGPFVQMGEGGPAGRPRCPRTSRLRISPGAALELRRAPRPKGLARWASIRRRRRRST